MFPFWLWPYPGRIISGAVLLVVLYFFAPTFITFDNVVWLAVLAYLAGHWVWYYYRRYVNGKVIAFDVGGVIAQGDYFTEHIKPMPGMYELVTNLRKNYITAVLSNNNRMVDPGFRQRFRSDNMFDVVYYSSDLGVKKPDPGVYKRFAAKIGVSPHKITFFDDDASNVEAAKSVGFNAHVFKDAGQAAEAIKGH